MPLCSPGQQVLTRACHLLQQIACLRVQVKLSSMIFCCGSHVVLYAICDGSPDRFLAADALYVLWAKLSLTVMAK